MAARTTVAATVAVAWAVATVLAGCGEQVPPIGDLPPERAAPAQSAGPGPTSEDPELVRRLRRLRPGGAAPGAVVVVDVTGKDRVGAPLELEFAKDGTLSDLRWDGWGTDVAVGRGSVRLLECTPSCSRGLRRRSVGTVRLTKLISCGGRRFYDAAEVSFGSGESRSFARAFIGAPC